MTTRLFLSALILLVVAVVVVQPVVAQQYVQKWDMYGGYSELITRSPSVDLSQHGYNFTVGRNINYWLALGLDFSDFRGNDGLSASGGDLAARLPSSLVAQVPAVMLQPLAATKFSLPYDASTWTVAVGPQFNLRKNKWATLFGGPFLGAFHNKVVANASNITVTQLPSQLPTGVTPQTYQAFLQGLQASIPANQKLTVGDATVMGYGIRAGVDFNVSKPIGVRIASEWIRTPLNHERQNNARIGFGLIYRFGGEVSRQ